MGDNLFAGLPPPSTTKAAAAAAIAATTTTTERGQPPIELPIAPLKPALKSALKRPKPAQEPDPENPPKDSVQDNRSGKRLRFKTTTDASETQVIEAMQKISSHIRNPAKFSKASKLAIQLIQAGNVKPGTSDHFFEILEAAMSSTIPCTDASVRADYHALFLAAQDAAESFSKKQNHQLATWTIKAVTANELFTDDSFVFSKTTGQIREAISSLPTATNDDDNEEAASLKDGTKATNVGSKETRQDTSLGAPSKDTNKEESDPFGLNAFLAPGLAKKDEKTKMRRETKKEEEVRRFLKSKRGALITCLEIAARRYKTPWCQTAIDILVKHAYDNLERFTSRQREAIEKLWASIREQQTRRKQGKSVNGKLDVTAFEWLQQKYSTEKISIRRAVGGSGDRHCEQWLG